MALHARWVRRRLGSALPDTLDPQRHPDWPLDSDAMSLEDIDFLATSDRVRAALRVRLRESDPDRRRKAVERLAHTIYRHFQVQAIFVEATAPDHPTVRYLFAADGRGWRGEKFVATAFSSP